MNKFKVARAQKEVVKRNQVELEGKKIKLKKTTTALKKELASFKAETKVRDKKKARINQPD